MVTIKFNTITREEILIWINTLQFIEKLILINIVKKVHKGGRIR